LDAAYDRPAWHGPNLRGSIRRVDARQASWRPAEGQRNLWEITLHAAYWKYVVWRKITGQKRGSFPRQGSDWFLRPEPSTPEKQAVAAWRDDIALLDTMHQQLREAVATLTREALEPDASGTTPLAALIAGIALHDVYHAGQIQIIKQMYPKASA
jgi:hypothetical protein